MKPTLLILAAGMGSRYGGLKQIDSIGPNGETILDYSIYDAIRAGFGKVVFVIRHDIETAFRETISRKFETRLHVEYVYQELDKLPAGFSVPGGRQKPWGTGHAILVGQEQINEPFAVINADDFYGFDSYRIVSNFLTTNQDSDIALVGFILRNTLSEFGTVSRGICQDNNGYIQTVVETTAIEKDGQHAKYVDNHGQTQSLTGDEIVSMNMWGFTPVIFDQLQHLFKDFLQTQFEDRATEEFYIPSAVTKLIAQNQARVELLRSQATWFGMTYQQDKSYVTEKIQYLIAEGVYPEKLFR
jgi:UTP-glucose-1-phosphate uridylyltransferase